MAAAMPRMLLVMVLTLLVAAPAAMAGTRVQIMRDCEDGKLDGNYTPSQIRDARNSLPADIDQYSECRDVLARALGGSGSGKVGGGAGADALGGGGGGSGEPLTSNGPDEEQALAQAATAGDTPVQVGARDILPGAAGFSSGAARNDLPASLLVALILLGFAAVGAAVPYVRRRVLARRYA